MQLSYSGICLMSWPWLPDMCKLCCSQALDFVLYFFVYFDVLHFIYLAARNDVDVLIMLMSDVVKMWDVLFRRGFRGPSNVESTFCRRI